jgi:hypothetical protein
MARHNECNEQHSCEVYIVKGYCPTWCDGTLWKGQGIEIYTAPTSPREGRPTPRFDALPKGTSYTHPGKHTQSLEEKIPVLAQHTLTEEDIMTGSITIPRRFLQLIPPEVKVIKLLTFADQKVICPIDWESQRLGGLEEWIGGNQLKHGDVVFLRYSENDFVIYTTWDNRIEDLIKRTKDMEDEEALQEALCGDTPFVDLVYMVLKREGAPLSYRDIGERVSKFRSTRHSTICGVLSRHKDTIFVRMGRNCWGLMEWESQKIPSKPQETEPGAVEKSEEAKARILGEAELRLLLLQIAEEDLVIHILREANKPLHVREIAEIIARKKGVPIEILLEQSFIDAEDPRLRRCPSGEWTLAVTDQYKDREIEVAPVSKTGWVPRKFVFTITFLLLLTLLVAGVLCALFKYKLILL